jgi:hypothetical protein
MIMEYCPNDFILSTLRGSYAHHPIFIETWCSRVAFTRGAVSDLLEVAKASLDSPQITPMG